MLWLAHHFADGSNGFSKDKKKAFIWYQKASDAGNYYAMVNVGENLIRGIGTPQDIGKGKVYMEKAEEGGSPFAAFMLGMHFLMGKYIPRDKVLGRQFLEKALSGAHRFRDLPERGKRIARQALDRLDAPS